MVDVAQLWLPILVSSVAVFFISSIVWMVLPHHKSDIKVLPDEKVFAERLAQFNIPPGTYMWPNCSGGDGPNSPEFKARMESGPWGSLNVVGYKPNFACNLVSVFAVYAVIGLFVAYLTGQSRGVGASFNEVFAIAGAAALLGYGMGGVPGAIFFSKPKRFVFTEFLDSVVYALATAAAFAWLWPGAVQDVPALAP